MNIQNARGPIEIRLLDLDSKIRCLATNHDDETTTELDVDSPSLAGASQELTGGLLAQGWAPANRWCVLAEHSNGPFKGQSRELSRMFVKFDVESQREIRDLVAATREAAPDLTLDEIVSAVGDALMVLRRTRQAPAAI